MILLLLVTAIAFVNLVTAIASFRKEKIPPLLKYPSVTIICRTWDDDHIVERFLKGCLDQDYAGKLEIILADDASDDKTPEIAKKYKGKITYIRANKHHRWKAHFLNPIIKKHVKSDILINTDIDAVLPPNYVSEMVRYLQKYDAVSSACIGGNPDNIIAKTRIVEDIWLFGAGMGGRYALTGKSAMYGGSHAVWMNVLKDVGYYGTKTMTEDAELTVMLNQKGYHTGFCDSMIVLLEDVESLEHYLNERKRWLYGPLKMAKTYKEFHIFNLIFGINVLFSLISLLSIILSLFDPLFLVPLTMSLVVHLLSLIRFKAQARVYFWIPYYIFVDPLLELAAFVGIVWDIVSGKGVKWVKVSGKKYHVGSPLEPVFQR